VTYRDNARPAEKELVLDDDRSIFWTVVGLVFLIFGVFLGVIGVVSIPNAKGVMDALFSLLFVAEGCFAAWMLRFMILGLFTKTHVFRNDETMRVELRRWKKVVKTVESRLDALSITLLEGSHARSGQKHWTVVLGTKSEDLKLSQAYFDRSRAESRKRLLEQFFALETVPTGVRIGEALTEEEEEAAAALGKEQRS